MTDFRRALVRVAATLLIAGFARAADLPAWLDAAVVAPVPDSARGFEAWVLHDETMVSVRARGPTSVTVRRAVRVLSESGRSRALCVAGYLRGTSEVKELHAWELTPDRRLRTWGRRDAVDRALSGDLTLDSEVRGLALAAPALVVGGVFAWEYTVEQPALLGSWNWNFADDVPVRLSRFVLQLPPGVEPRAHGPDSARAVREADTWTWERRDVPAYRTHTMESYTERTGSMLWVELTGAGHTPDMGFTFGDWGAAAAWLDSLTAPSGRPTPDVEQRAHEVVGAAVDTLARLRALARHVQSVNYVSIQLDMSRGGGYRPRTASEVLRGGYGDCKDKANLFCALARAIGVQAWLMPVYYGDREHVLSTWCSPGQFNHCIAVVRAPESARLPSAIETPGLGRLLVFDPTDPLTPFGDLPELEQGSLALLVDARRGGLVRLPVLACEANGLVRSASLELDSTGVATASIDERRVGQAAQPERVPWRFGHDAFRRRVEERLSAHAGVFQLAALEVDDDSVSGGFRLRARGRAPGLARRMSGGLLVLRPAFPTAREGAELPDPSAGVAIALPAACEAESVTVRLPAGFAVEEVPAGMEVAFDFGRLRATWAVDGDELRFARTWQVTPGTLPAGRAKDVRALFQANQSARQKQVVLVRR